MSTSNLVRVLGLDRSEEILDRRKHWTDGDTGNTGPTGDTERLATGNTGPTGYT
jgi:hypothetical protein